MTMFDEIQISKAIAEAYHRKVLNHLASDVIIVGAGPSGLTAAYYLARSGLKVTVMEKRLSPGGGIWGGGMAMNEVVLQEEALQIADEFGIRHVRTAEGLHTADSVELACALCLKALQAGAAVLNLLTVEDIRVQQGKVNGVVVNRTGVYPTLHVDPITFSAGAVLDATGHEAILVATASGETRSFGLLEGLAIPRASQNQEAAIEFVKFMCSPEIQLARAVEGGEYVPTRER